MATNTADSNRPMGSDIKGKDHGSYYTDKDFELHPNDSRDNALSKIRTAGSITIPPELFEKLYLSPENRVKGDLRKTFGNPTPVGLAGFLLSLSPLSCFLMNWRGTLTGLGASNIAAYMFFGGVLMMVSGFFELILGNTFPAVVFTTFGAFWLTFGGTLQPFYGAWSAFAPDPVAAPQVGLTEPAFFNAFAFFLLFMGLLCLVYLVCSLRTNLVFFLIFLPLPPAFGCLAASFWFTGMGNMAYAETLQIAGGALSFIVCVLGWYLFTALMLAAVDAPIALPVFDLSTRIKGANDRKKLKGSLEGDV
ncbi:Putative acetate transporter GPR1/FUN34/SatP family [Septoria linicola]|uniref:Acetate transporter GPR1/FUN34/SatP family n=1 Tax=Septoria linicola TaxID=215465 RepID=A0A9Q9ELR6_9PEZI|nr:Putative acetate transporter GPR1/FUN34/SatP family [Septoria linicola]